MNRIWIRRIAALALLTVVTGVCCLGQADARPTPWSQGQVAMIDPTVPLMDTGIDLEAGAGYFIRFEGWWCTSCGVYPERSESYHSLEGQLWAKIGIDGEEFGLTGTTDVEAFRADVSGRLYLFVPDIDHSDNLGSGVAIVYALKEPALPVSTGHDVPGVGVGGRESSVWLERPTPNPSNPSTSFRVGALGEQRVEVSVFDIRGRLIRTLGKFKPGRDGLDVRWDGQDGSGAVVASGVYYVRAVGEEGMASQKVTLLK